MVEKLFGKSAKLQNQEQKISKIQRGFSAKYDISQKLKMENVQNVQNSKFKIGILGNLKWKISKMPQ